MLWLRPKARLKGHARLRWIIPLGCVAALTAIAAQGYSSALQSLARAPIFLSTARLTTASVATSETAADSGIKQARRKTDRPLDIDDAEAASTSEVVALSKVSETDPPAVVAAQPALRASAPAAEPSHARSGRRHQSHRQSYRTQTYRTVCVRLCDGAYFPISYATTQSHFATDAAACASRCESPSRLYVYRSGDSPDGMRDLDGNPYIKLTTAFAFRTGTSRQCTCRAKPWDEASRERHRMYDLEAKATGGDQAAARELALRRALAEVRDTAPDPVLAALGTAGAEQDNGNSSSMFAFGPPVVAPLDEASVRPPPPPRYAGQLERLSVVLDATGSPVRRHPLRGDRPVKVTVLAKVAEPTTVAAAVAVGLSAEPLALEPHVVGPSIAVPVTQDAPDPGLSMALAKAQSPAELDGAASARGPIGRLDERATAEAEPAPPKSKLRGKSRAARLADRSRRHGERIHGERGRHDFAVGDTVRHAAAARPKLTERGRHVARADPEPDWREVLFRPY